MARSIRGRISVDLGSLRGKLFEQARARGVRLSDFVRSSLADSLGTEVPVKPALVPAPPTPAAPASGRARLNLRMSAADAAAVIRAAHAAGLSPGAYMAGLVNGVPILSGGAERAEHLAALTQSNAELASLSRNIRHLSSLLREGSVRAAQEYRGMLDTLADDVRRHVTLASAVLGELRPRGQPTGLSTKERQ
jgi:hypothetical protein